MPDELEHPAAVVRRYVRRALASLPLQYADALDNVEFVVQRAPSPRERRRLGLHGTLYGFYEGTPLTQRGGYDRAVPDRITIFWGPLRRDFLDNGELEEEVRKTVLHEIGHYFGLSEADLAETSVH